MNYINCMENVKNKMGLPGWPWWAPIILTKQHIFYVLESSSVICPNVLYSSEPRNITVQRDLYFGVRSVSFKLFLHFRIQKWNSTTFLFTFEIPKIWFTIWFLTIWESQSVILPCARCILQPNNAMLFGAFILFWFQKCNFHLDLFD